MERFIHMSIARHFTAAALILMLAACGSPTYRICLKDGREFHSKGKPEFQKKTGYYQYENLNGRDALVRADEVLTIEEQ